MTLAQNRQQWEQEALAVPLPSNISTTEEVISGVSCVWVADAESTTKKVIVYLHGGGLIAGSAITHQGLAAALASSSKASVLLVNYRLLPEHDYPAPLEDALAVYRALLSDYEYEPSQLILGGDSSGGGLCIAALVRLKELNEPQPYAAFTLSGTFDMTLSGESMVSNVSTEPHMSAKELKKWQETYLHYDLKSPLLSPLFADLSDLPKVLLLAGGQEPWLRDSENLAQKIGEAGGTVKLRVWDSLGHVWMMNPELSESLEAFEEITKFVCARDVE